MSDIIRHTLCVPDGLDPIRVDAFIVNSFPEFSRSKIAMLIDEKFIIVDNDPCRRSKKLHGGEKIQISLPQPDESSLTPVQMNIDIIYEDKFLAVINKPAGLIVHPGANTKEPTLVHGLLCAFPDIADLDDDERPGIVHRLDKGTSGCLIVARTEETRLKLIKMFADREIKKEYYTLVKNVPSTTTFEIDQEIGRSEHDRKKMSVKSKSGKSALTYVTLIEQYGNIASALNVRIITGRTHQIRVHLAYMNLPVIGDGVYGKAAKVISRETGAERQMLHARKLTFNHPISGNELSFTAEIPDDIAQIRQKLKHMAESEEV